MSNARKDGRNDSTENMVLRTVFLPVALDDALKSSAERNKVSKGELIRQALESQLHKV
jgi:hypothetical protein